MYALKTPAFLRPSSRPSSPLPSPGTSGRGDSDTNGMDQRSSRPISKALGLSPLNRKSSPAPARSMTPATLIQDNSYLESLSLRLSEAVTKALAQPPGTAGAGVADVLNGKRPIPPDRGHTLGQLIAAELHASHGKIHLQRAILRQLQRPLSVLITNLSSILLPLLSTSAFLTPPAPTVSAPNPNPTQLHALGVAGFAAELLECLDGLDLDVSHDHRGDGLNSIREGLVSIIGRVVNPLIGGLKGDLLPLLRALETARPTSLSSPSIKPVNSNKNQHPSITSLQTLMPIYARALKRYTASKAIQSTLATFLISAVWTALVALSHRPSVPRSRSNSASAASAASSSAFKLRLSSSTTPPPTPPASRFSMKLPGSRPPSPVHSPVPSTASDARVIFDLLNTLPKPTPTNDATKDAREAVDEAFEALAALSALLGAVDSGSEVREDFDLELLTEGLPVLIALPVLLRWSGHGEPQVIHAMLGIDEREYREGCLSGFGRADECETMVAERMVDILDNETTDDMKTKMVVDYLESCIEH